MPTPSKISACFITSTCSGFSTAVEPVCSSTCWVVGSPMVSVTPGGGGPAGSGASNGSWPWPSAAVSGRRGPEMATMATAVAIATLTIATAPARVEGIGEVPPALAANR